MKKKSKLIVSPENQMKPKDMANFTPPTNNQNHKPIIELTKEKTVLYMGLQNLIFAETAYSDYMASIVYDIKEKTIEMRGRMRTNLTGNKTIFSDKEPIPYTKANYIKMKWRVQDIVKKLPIDVPLFRPVDDFFSLEFAIGEDIDSITQKMNDSNRFNIGILPKK